MIYPQEAISFLVAQEDGDQSYYDRTEEHWDWPGGASGPTAGVGYDCGYVTQQECTNDWKGIVDDETLANMLRGVGLTSTRAHIFVNNNRKAITVTWAQALAEFTQREIPKWDARCRLSLPNWDLLSGLCAGALLSLSYNRGTEGYHSGLPRFREMAEIHRLMVKGQWPLITVQIAQMARLWPNVADLRRRRALEAQMFASGVPGCKPLNPPPTPPPATEVA